jgi:hypothetical protein
MNKNECICCLCGRVLRKNNAVTFTEEPRRMDGMIFIALNDYLCKGCYVNWKIMIYLRDLTHRVIDGGQFN